MISEIEARFIVAVLEGWRAADKYTAEELEARDMIQDVAFGAKAVFDDLAFSDILRATRAEWLYQYLGGKL